jgi:hypothetical protein
VATLRGSEIAALTQCPARSDLATLSSTPRPSGPRSHRQACGNLEGLQCYRWPSHSLREKTHRRLRHPLSEISDA